MAAWTLARDLSCVGFGISNVTMHIHNSREIRMFFTVKPNACIGVTSAMKVNAS